MVPRRGKTHRKHTTPPRTDVGARQKAADRGRRADEGAETAAGSGQQAARRKTVGLRIIGGRFRGRKLAYSGDMRVRPMKDRVREAVFNLVGPAVRGKHSVDLFAGTGALGLEALSRGAVGATFIERHYPTAQVIRQNIATLGVEKICEVVTANVFLWAKRLDGAPLCARAEGEQGARVSGRGSDCCAPGPLAPVPWIVFSSPPYDFYVERLDDMLHLLGTLIRAAPAQSLFVVESDERLDFSALPAPDDWDIRSYPPAVIGVYESGVQS